MTSPHLLFKTLYADLFRHGVSLSNISQRLARFFPNSARAQSREIPLELIFGGRIRYTSKENCAT